MNNVLLVGIGGVYNYGCEAIVRGTVKILKSINPNIQITYASYNYDDDVRRLDDLDICIIRRNHPARWSPRNIIRKLLSYFKITYPIPYDNAAAFKGYDCVLSIGGDMYTLNHDSSFNTQLPDFMARLKRQGCKYVLWGCSVGPFEKNPEAVTYYKKHLNLADLIVAREQSTIEYLRSIGVSKNVKFAPDPAFVIDNPYCNNDLQSKKRITFGINLSPLSALYEYGDFDKPLEAQAEFVKWLINTYDSNIILLPHVISTSDHDNDLTYLKKLHSILPPSISHRIIIADNDPGFIGLKKQILQCNIVIASRMHCAINAVTCGVPALFLSYSSKSKGMSRLVYGHEENVISLRDLSQIQYLKPKIDRLLSSKLNIAHIKSFNFADIIADK